MGIYDKVQKKLGKAFDTKLSDAVRVLQFVSIIDNYDPVTMKSTQTEVDTDVRCIVLKDIEEEEKDSSSDFDYMNLIVLDSDRNGVTFEEDMRVRYNSKLFKIESFYPDPAEASWNIKCRKLG